METDDLIVKGDMIVASNGFFAFTDYLHFREGENPDEEKMLVELVKKKFPSKYEEAELAILHNKDVEAKPTPVFIECDEIRHDYFLEHLDGIIKMVEESKTYDELKSKWDAFYKSIPEKYIIDIQY
jgi:hypothetical protein